MVRRSSVDWEVGNFETSCGEEFHGYGNTHIYEMLIILHRIPVKVAIDLPNSFHSF